MENTRKFECRFYGKTYHLTAEQLNTAYDIITSLVMLRKGV